MTNYVSQNQKNSVKKIHFNCKLDGISRTSFRFTEITPRTQSKIFGKDGGSNLAQESNIPLLGKLPLDIKIREEADNGKPTVIKDPDHIISEKFREIAKKISAEIAKLPISYAHIMPNVKVKN